MSDNIFVKIAERFAVKKWRQTAMANKIDELKDLLRENNFYLKREEEKKINPWLVVLIVIGAIAVIAGIAYAVYYFLIPEDSEYFEDMDDFEDEISDDDLEGDE